MNAEGVRLEIEIERAADGRWLADILLLPGVMAYGETRAQAIANVKVLALPVIADEIEHGERSPDIADAIFAIAAYAHGQPPTLGASLPLCSASRGKSSTIPAAIGALAAPAHLITPLPFTMMTRLDPR